MTIYQILGGITAIVILPITALIYVRLLKLPKKR